MRLRRPSLGRRPGTSLLTDLRVEQDGRYVDIELRTVAGAAPLAVWARILATGEWIRLAEVVSGPDGQHARIDLLNLPAAADEEGATAAIRLEFEQVLPADSDALQRLVGRPDVEMSEPVAGDVVVRSRPPLGSATRTHLGALHEVSDAHHRLTPYPNARGGLAVAIDRDLNTFGAVHVSRLAVRRGVLRMHGRLETRHGELQRVELVLKGRTTDNRITRPVPVEFDAARTEEQFGLRWYSYDAEVECASLLSDQAFVNEVYDAWFRLWTRQSADPFEVRVGRTRLLARYFTRGGWADRAGRSVAVAPYYTFKAKRTSFNVNIFDADTFAYLRRQIRLRHLTRLLHWRRNIWLVGERPYKAQDTGYAFFRYLREHRPDVEAYYVIDRSSPERANVEPLGNVVDFGSREHIRLALLARKVVGSHHPDFLYPLRTKEFARTMRATNVFLQHGVMGTKWMASLYGKKAPGFTTDLFVVSSEREREYIVTDFGYDLDEIAVTGLPRFDSLFADDVETNQRQLLIMPTWRDWLQDSDTYRESEYHEVWSGLLHDPRFQALVEQHQLDPVFYLHPNMQQYRHLFDDAPVRVIGQGERDVQLLLKQSAMLITDYSSVGFDFSFLHKPVAYFQFDRERFLGPQGSHLDLDEELPGPIFRSPGSLLAELQRRIEDGFRMDAEYVRRADRFIAHRDRNSSERIYQRMLTAKPHGRRRQRFGSHEVVAAVPRYLRRHRGYFPAMRRMFGLLKLFPADPRAVLFESGVGRQYADSPRYIYEELVRSHPELVKIWVYNRRLPTTDPNTRIVKRLSPGYFYYLARAKYWVNNQSFPHYITRRREGVYLQTWHGTPLKRMVHDMVDSHASDRGHLERAITAARQWTHLVSPNPFTTNVMRSAYSFTGPALELGYPRNDVFYRPDREQLAARIRSRLGISPDQRVILYAPTFRDDQVNGSGRFTFDLPFDLERMHAGLGEDTVLLLRMHVLISGRLEIPGDLRDVVRDVTDYPEIQDLFLASDVLVTDYSSVFFDYAALGRPIVFFAYDLDAYRDSLRGFNLDYDKELPGPVVRTEAELIDALSRLDEIESEFRERRAEFLARFSPMDDGRAAERVVAAIFGPGPPPLSEAPPC